jgi:hypothetical protein
MRQAHSPRHCEWRHDPVPDLEISHGVPHGHYDTRELVSHYKARAGGLVATVHMKLPIILDLSPQGDEAVNPRIPSESYLEQVGCGEKGIAMGAVVVIDASRGMHWRTGCRKT